jgi:hypothetical protein
MNSRRLVLLVSSGQRPDRPFRNVPGFRIESIRVGELLHHNLYGYTAVIVGSWTSDFDLAKCTRKLIDYVNGGGILVCLGCLAYEAQWVPFCDWNKGEPAKATWDTASQDAERLFLNINPNLLKFHEFWGHGTLNPPPDATVLALGGDQPMMCIVDKGVKGAALLTTIDPDFHALTGLRTIDKTLEEEKKEAARRLIHNILNWCGWKYEQCHSKYSRFWRRCIGMFSLSTLYLVLVLIVWPLTFVTSVRYFTAAEKYDIWLMLPGIASLGGLGLYLSDKWKQIRD